MLNGTLGCTKGHSSQRIYNRLMNYIKLWCDGTSMDCLKKLLCRCDAIFRLSNTRKKICAIITDEVDRGDGTTAVSGMLENEN